MGQAVVFAQSLVITVVFLFVGWAVLRGVDVLFGGAGDAILIALLLGGNLAVTAVRFVYGRRASARRAAAWHAEHPDL